MNSTRPIARAVRAKQMVPEAAYVPLGVQRIIRCLFPFYAIARANDILRLRALVTISIISYKLMTNIFTYYKKKSCTYASSV